MNTYLRVSRSIDIRYQYVSIFGVLDYAMMKSVCGAIWFDFVHKSHPNYEIKKFDLVWFN